MLERLIFSFTCFIFGSYIPIQATELNKSPESAYFLNYSLQQLTETKVTVASLSEEKISEAPVPVSLITSKMIQSSGALTLKELLLAYVPGFTDVEDQNEINIASRGIFTSSQQKILILINGHRLNNGSYAMASPDHSISLGKVEQIEVLRGPASAIYGNVSLTATINIILKKGSDVAGTKISAIVGDYGQKGTSILHGSQTKNYDFLLWGNVYEAEGELRKISPQESYSEAPITKPSILLNGIKDKKSYDVGFNISTPFGHLFLNQRQSHYIEPFSAGGLSGEPYEYDKFKKINGWGPGLGYTSTHVEFKNQFTVSGWENEIRLYWDKFHTQSGIIISPTSPTYGGPTWKDISAGIQTTSQLNTANGNLLVGTQIEGFKVYGDQFHLGINNFAINRTDNNMLPAGKESSYSLFSQYKHYLNANWQANFGLRYDFKNRRTTKNIDEISPRLGLLYQHDNASIKFSYSQAFVDANYWNRFSNLASFKGASNLKPEKLQSIQISPSYIFPDLNIQLTSNLFFDQSIDVIFRDNFAKTNNYSNAGKLNTWGLEQEISYITPSFTIRFNGTYRQATSSEKIAVQNDYINNIPNFTSNLVIEKKINDKLNFHLNVRYVGKQFSPIIIQQDGEKAIDPYPNEGVNFHQPNHFEDHHWLINSNIRYQINKNISFNVRADNLFDTDYKQGGTTLHPYPKKGRWLHLNVELTF